MKKKFFHRNAPQPPQVLLCVFLILNYNLNLILEIVTGVLSTTADILLGLELVAATQRKEDILSPDLHPFK